LRIYAKALAAASKRNIEIMTSQSSRKESRPQTSAIAPATEDFTSAQEKACDQAKHRVAKDPLNQIRSFDKIMAEQQDFHNQRKVYLLFVVLLLR
jgi:hypothetical protein